jgi:hypothetical protein
LAIGIHADLIPRFIFLNINRRTTLTRGGGWKGVRFDDAMFIQYYKIKLRCKPTGPTFQLLAVNIVGLDVFFCFVFVPAAGDRKDRESFVRTACVSYRCPSVRYSIARIFLIFTP